MEKIRFFTDLLVWKKGHELALLIYRLTKSFPTEEKYGLVSQMRRSSVSVTSNLAEGFGRRGKADKKRFYDMSIGSLYELENQLFIARDVDLISTSDSLICDNLIQEVRRMLLSWIGGSN
jgi:four helix bundle protein